MGGVADKQSGLSVFNYKAVRAALALTYSLFDKAGAGPHAIYDHLAEGELHSLSERAYSDLDGGDWSWSIPSSLAGAVKSTAARIRALDRLLVDFTLDHGPPSDIEFEYLCLEADWYVIPRLTARAPRTGYGGRSTFPQRGTLHHRLLPHVNGSYTIDLKWSHDIGLVGPNDLLGASMFEWFSLECEYESDPARFRATGIDCPGARRTIQENVKLANSNSCSAMVWPELSMRPEKELQVLKNSLEELALSDARGGAPSFTMAGSWHLQGENGIENVAPILDFRGQEIMQHRKSRVYADNKIGLEDIYSEYRIPVLVTQDQLIAFAICRDYCDLEPGIPYPTLSVDMVIVSSLGNKQTMASHRGAAGHTVTLGGRVFVVQQEVKRRKGKVGWVLPPSKQPGILELAKLRKPRWSVHPGWE